MNDFVFVSFSFFFLCCSSELYSIMNLMEVFLTVGEMVGRCGYIRVDKMDGYEWALFGSVC